MGPRGGDARESPGFALFPKKRVGGPARRRRSRARRERVRDALERARTARRPGASDRPGGRLCGEPRRPLERWPRGRAVEDALHRVDASARRRRRRGRKEGCVVLITQRAASQPRTAGRRCSFLHHQRVTAPPAPPLSARSRARWRRRTRTPRRGRPLRPLGGRAASLRAQGVPRGKMGAPGSGRPLITTVAPWAIPTTRAGPSSSTARFQPRGTTRAWAPPPPGEPATSPSKRGAASLAPTPSPAPPEPNAAPLAFLNQCPGLSGAARGWARGERASRATPPPPLTPPPDRAPRPIPDRPARISEAVPHRSRARSREPPALALTRTPPPLVSTHPSDKDARLRVETVAYGALFSGPWTASAGAPAAASGVKTKNDGVSSPPSGIRTRIVVPVFQRTYCWPASKVRAWWRDAALGRGDSALRVKDGHATGRCLFRRVAFEVNDRLDDAEGGEGEGEDATWRAKAAGAREKGADTKENIAAWLCLDGQQRCTTTQLAVAAVRDAAEATLRAAEEEEEEEEEEEGLLFSPAGAREAEMDARGLRSPPPENIYSVEEPDGSRGKKSIDVDAALEVLRGVVARADDALFTDPAAARARVAAISARERTERNETPSVVAPFLSLRPSRADRDAFARCVAGFGRGFDRGFKGRRAKGQGPTPHPMDPLRPTTLVRVSTRPRFARRSAGRRRPSTDSRRTSSRSTTRPRTTRSHSRSRRRRFFRATIRRARFAAAMRAASRWFAAPGGSRRRSTGCSRGVTSRGWRFWGPTTTEIFWAGPSSAARARDARARRRRRRRESTSRRCSSGSRRRRSSPRGRCCGTPPPGWRSGRATSFATPRWRRFSTSPCESRKTPWKTSGRNPSQIECEREYTRRAETGVAKKTGRVRKPRKQPRNVSTTTPPPNAATMPPSRTRTSRTATRSGNAWTRCSARF